jgi:hypothetical protein
VRAAAVAACASLALASPAGAARVRIAVFPAVASPGAAIRVVGNAGSCPRGDTVAAISAAFPGHAFGKGALSGRVRAGGAFTIRGHVRARARPGRYVVTARCGGGNLGVAAYLRVR